ncbi:hypothetical protein GH714_039912 [Hevea brasiliensis]|uniref:Protein SirB1 N-terminal domain-containing protein n=1 Tax=Hevea brasiliensis TaxID=3981 RepID=A0A6A6MTG7_HEVBR|nr:hypothetical protein GH714_039912 [Hevea brasiliensis]
MITSASSPPPIPTASLVQSPSPSSPRRRLLCRGASPPTSNLKFVLHDALDSLGFDTSYARESRTEFLTQIQNLSDIERETSISINRCVDLGKTALYIAAEDDSLVSHSSVPLPVDDFIQLLDDLSMGYCSSYNSSFSSSPEIFLHSFSYLYVNKGFRRTDAKDQLEAQGLYLPSVLTHRSGSAVMLSLIYSEILKMLRLWGLVDFDCEIFFPYDLQGLPRGYDTRKSKESEQPFITTTQTLLEETLRNLKEAFWPFQYDNTKSLFLRAAHAANCIDKSKNLEDSDCQLAPAESAQHRLLHGVQTRKSFGDMMLALSACERLILLESDPKELRDYGILLYHCGFYEQSQQCLKMYQDTKSFSLQKQPSNKFDNLEEDAVEKLMVRLDLILMEKGWSKP